MDANLTSPAYLAWMTGLATDSQLPDATNEPTTRALRSQTTAVWNASGPSLGRTQSKAGSAHGPRVESRSSEPAGSVPGDAYSSGQLALGPGADDCGAALPPQAGRTGGPSRSTAQRPQATRDRNKQSQKSFRERQKVGYRCRHVGWGVLCCLCRNLPVLT